MQSSRNVIYEMSAFAKIALKDKNEEDCWILFLLPLYPHMEELQVSLDSCAKNNNFFPIYSQGKGHILW